jgi:hypothetical protein
MATNFEMKDINMMPLLLRFEGLAETRRHFPYAG